MRRPDARPAAAPADPLYVEIGARLMPIILETQKVTLAGFRILDPNGVVIITHMQPISVIFTLPAAALAQARLTPGQTDIAAVALAFDKKLELDHGQVELIDNQPQALIMIFGLAHCLEDADPHPRSDEPSARRRRFRLPREGAAGFARDGR